MDVDVGPRELELYGNNTRAAGPGRKRSEPEGANHLLGVAGAQGDLCDVTKVEIPGVGGISLNVKTDRQHAF
ncbi:hypothetical protein ACMHYB_33330 [Sorangium sp. So ce1128]